MEGSDRGGIEILHVEDDREIAELCATFLRRQEDVFRIRTEYEPEDGLTVLESEQIDCIISDYEMPGKNGIDFLKTVRRNGIDLPFILFTGKGSEEVASEAISAGVTDYLQKSGHTEQYAILANRVKNAVEGYRREQEAEQYHQQLEAITRHSRDAIVTMDAESRIQFANPAVEDHFGYTPEELQGERLTILMPERLRDRHLRGIDRYVRTGERSVTWSNVEFHGLHKDGYEILLSISYGEYAHDGEQWFIGIMREKSERYRFGIRTVEPCEENVSVRG